MLSAMASVRDIIVALGRAELTASLGVSKAAVTNAIARDRIPETWRGVVTAMAALKAVDVPEDLYRSRQIPVPHSLEKQVAAE